MKERKIEQISSKPPFFLFYFFICFFFFFTHVLLLFSLRMSSAYTTLTRSCSWSRRSLGRSCSIRTLARLQRSLCLRWWPSRMGAREARCPSGRVSSALTLRALDGRRRRLVRGWTNNSCVGKARIQETDEEEKQEEEEGCSRSMGHSWKVNTSE